MTPKRDRPKKDRPKKNRKRRRAIYRGNLTASERALDDRILAEGLHLKHDTQLAVMRDGHDTKRARCAAQRLRVFSYPDSVRWELHEQGDLSDAEIDVELAGRQAYWDWKITRLAEVVELLDAEIAFRATGRVARDPIGTAYFIDSDGGNDGNAGTSTGAAWATLDKFTENARSAGDVATLRRGTAAVYGSSDLLFTSDGALSSPIVAEADYDDDFGDHVDLSVTATATLTFGSKTITFASDISGVLAAGDAIYVTAEDAREFAYEVASVSTVTVTLYLPYKGGEAGSGKAMTNMQSMPKWNTAAGNFRVDLNTDEYWMFRGIHFLGTHVNGIIQLSLINNFSLIDCVMEGNDVSDKGIHFLNKRTTVFVSKCRIFNCGASFFLGSLGGAAGVVRDTLFDGNGLNGSGILANSFVNLTLIDCEMKNAFTDINFQPNNQATQIHTRNCLFNSPREVLGHHTSNLWSSVLTEDHDGTPGDTRHLTRLSSAENVPVIQSDMSTVRSGGSVISIKVTPSTNMAFVQGWESSRQLLFELPLYATTDSKTYEVYFRPAATADWTADPTASELWIEIEYWGHASNNHRRLVRSTGVIDMNGSTNWVALSLTVAPAQAGVLYLRAYYAKTKESGKANTFFCDPIPVVA